MACGGVLDDKGALFVTFKRGDGRVAGNDKGAFRIGGMGRASCWGGVGRQGANADGGRQSHRFGDGARAVAAIGLAPTFPQGARDVPLKVVGLLGEFGEEGVLFALDAAQDGVDKFGGLASDRFGRLHGFSDGGVLGHAGHHEKLRGSHHERGPEFAGRHALNALFEHPFKRQHPTQHGVGEFQRVGMVRRSLEGLRGKEPADAPEG